MKWFRSLALAVAATLVAAWPAWAGKLEIAYWGEGTLQWLQVDGASYTVDYDSVVIKDIYEGAHTITFGTASASRTINVYLSGGNSAASGQWCMSLELDEYEFLGDSDCEEMWDYYFFY